MKLVDSSVIPEPVEFIFNLLSVVVTKHFLFSLIYVYVVIIVYKNSNISNSNKYNICNKIFNKLHKMYVYQYIISCYFTN